MTLLGFVFTVHCTISLVHLAWQKNKNKNSNKNFIKNGIVFTDNVQTIWCRNVFPTLVELINNGIINPNCLLTKAGFHFLSVSKQFVSYAVLQRTEQMKIICSYVEAMWQLMSGFVMCLRALWCMNGRISRRATKALTHDLYQHIHNFKSHVLLQKFVWCIASRVPHRQIGGRLRSLTGNVEWISERAENVK